ncbi:hypothetical protein [Thermomonas sp.]|uniref:hypothetical protein n=1 Tax=Thermomonas sp. TaxID=1971895 RepID=UPI00263322E8|nr:hypothetical protein [Thermomonas sp.]MBL0227054.1 hypothetical protein [Thermomonas sp.]
MKTPRQSVFVPKLWTVLRNGYRGGDFRHDTVAGSTVAIVSLPLAMALVIASGTTPDKVPITAVLAGFLVSARYSLAGADRIQIGAAGCGLTLAFHPAVNAWGGGAGGRASLLPVGLGRHRCGVPARWRSAATVRRQAHRGPGPAAAGDRRRHCVEHAAAVAGGACARLPAAADLPRAPGIPFAHH